MNFDPEALRNDLAGAFPAPIRAMPAAIMLTNDKCKWKCNIDRQARAPLTPAAITATRVRSCRPPKMSRRAINRSQRSAICSAIGRTRRRRLLIQTAIRQAPTSATPVPRHSSRIRRLAHAAKPSPVTINAAKSSESAAGHFGEKSATTTIPRPSLPASSSTNRAPVIITDMEGPKQITIGREASYHLRLRNDGATAADDFVATIRIPGGRRGRQFIGHSRHRPPSPRAAKANRPAHSNGKSSGSSRKPRKRSLSA